MSGALRDKYLYGVDQHLYGANKILADQRVVRDRPRTQRPRLHPMLLPVTMPLPATLLCLSRGSPAQSTRDRGSCAQVSTKAASRRRDAWWLLGSTVGWSFLR